MKTKENKEEKKVAEKVKEPKYIPNPKKIEGEQWHYEMTCLFCESEFHAKRRTAKFCSDTCRVMHYYGEMKKATKQKQTTIFAESKQEVIAFFKKLGYNLGDGTIARNGGVKEVTVKGDKWIIKRLSHKTYGIERMI